ncbi:hypothetical protein ACFW04_013336 [Cataglyphis niger]
MNSIIQINLNRSPRAFDLLQQNMRELNIGVAAISEPPFISNRANRFYSSNGLAMIFHDSGLTGASPVLAFQGNNVVVVRMGEVYLVSCYVSPNIPRGEFLEFVDELDDALAHSKNKILICGDFNSKSKLWGSPFSDERGTTIDEWAAASDLRLLNTGSDPTCIRAQGCSIIDLTWASPGLVRYISSWQVLDLSTLSDHVYIVVKFDNNRQVEYNQTKKKICRWNWKKADWEKFQDSLLWSCTSNLSNIEIEPDVDKIADTLDAEMKMACDNSAPKALPPQGKKSMYWWNDTIAETRADTNAAYRAWKRIRRIRNPNPHEEELLRQRYRIARKKLRAEINTAKSVAWKELLDVVESDPWGLPYRLVLNKLRSSPCNILDNLDADSKGN